MLFFIGLFLALAFAAQAQLPEKFTEPIPLDTGEGASMEPNANRILFFRHPGVPESDVNFQTAMSQIEYGINQQITAIDLLDLLGTPGFPVTSKAKFLAANMEQLLADPVGLCFENLLINLLCERDWIAGEARHQPSWQLLVADLRNYHSTEPHIFGLDPEVANVTLAGQPNAQPYHQFGLSALIATTGEEPSLLEYSPPAICYDIVAAEDWIACPVFGKIYVRVYTTVRKTTIWGEVVELHSPVLVYRASSGYGRYHLVGYLANPLSPWHYEDYNQDNPEPQVRKGNADFPMAIAAGNFASTSTADIGTDVDIGAGGLSDIAVMGTATLPHLNCDWRNDLMADAGLPPWPWGLSCTRGIVWTRTRVGWEDPVRDTFDSAYLLAGAPKTYDLAEGRGATLTSKKSELFAAVNEPALDGRYYVLKYFDIDPIDHDETPELGKLVPPTYIEVFPPGENSEYGPFRIVAAQVNGDELADFAITWKKTEDELVNTENRIWKGDYLPSFSVFFSRETDTGVEYDQSDFQVSDPEAELAAIAFGKKEEQHYLVVGNNKRLASEDGSYHAYAYLFPIQGGVIDNLNVKTVKMSFEGDGDDAATAGIGDITTHPSSFIMGAALRDPYLRAPESCNSTDVDNDHAVYGHLWLGTTYVGREEFHTLDFDHDGVPNRCECSVAPNETNDADSDELADVPGCDRCPGEVDLDLELNDEGTLVGDGIPDACDNCPAERCEDYSFELNPQNCINSSQADDDGDEKGDSCDGCPENPARTLRGVYFFGPTSEDCLGDLTNCLGEPYVYCSGCANAFVAHQDMTYSRGDVEAEVEAGDVVWASGVSICEPGDDTDGDSIFAAYDNCLNVTNTAQTDSDGDGSGDACDCDLAGEFDDCDNDGVPNRFDNCPFVANSYQNNTDYDKAGDECDSFPFDATQAHLQKPMPDTVYDPYAGYIADRRNLKLAQAFGILEEVRNALNNFDFEIYQPQAQPKVCGYPDKTYPGPRPCHHMGRSGKEVTVILPSVSEVTQPPPCLVGENPECTPPPCLFGDLECTFVDPGPTTGRNVAQYCIATVGRQNPKTAAIFEWEQAQVINANNRAKEITGIENFDIFVGAEGGIIHWECAFLAGAFTSVAQATEILPEASVAQATGNLLQVSGPIAPFFLIQTSGLPPIPYERRPDPELAIAPPKALLLAPLAGPATPEGAAFSLAPSLSQALVGRQLQRMPAEGIQFGTLRENINGKMVVKVLHSQSDFEAEGTYLAVGDLHSLITVDLKTPPEPWTLQPVELRLDKPELPLRALEDKVALWRRMGRAITPEIYRELPWQPRMYAEFLVGQSTVSEAVVEANKSLSPDEQPMPEEYLHQVYLPAYIKAARFDVGGGCGCNIEAESFSVAWLLYLLCLIAPVPVLMYYRRRTRK